MVAVLLLIVTSPTIDKKLEITIKTSEIYSKLTKNLENRLNIFEFLVNFEFIFEVFMSIST